MKVEDFENHKVFDKIEQLKKAVIGSDLLEFIGEEEYHYFEVVLQFIEEKMKLIVPILIEESELNSLSSEIESGTSNINNYLGNKNIGYINNAKNNFSSALKRIKSFIIPSNSSDFDYSKAAVNFEQTLLKGYKSIEEINRNLQSELVQSNKLLDEQNKKIEVLEKEFASMLADMKGAFSSELQSYSAFEEESKVSYNSFMEEKGSVFNDKIKEIDTTIDGNLKQYEEWVTDDLTKYEKEFNEQKELLDTQTTDTVESLKAKLEEAKNIVDIIGNVGVTGNYQKIATEHKRTANIFRVIALIFMGLMSGLLAYSIIELSLSGEFDLYKSLVRILAASVLTYPAIYASRESNKHRNLETINRKLELELASLGPFIELLPEEKKIEIKGELVGKYFGQQGVDNVQSGDEDVSINGFERILKAILPILKK